MNIEQLRKSLEHEHINTFTFPYRKPEDKEAYGEVLEAMTDKGFVFVKANKATFKAARMICEFGGVSFVFNGVEVSFRLDELDSVKVVSWGESTL